MVGIRVSKTIGIGDAVQFTSIPENYYRYHGDKLVDLEEHWVFDHNPFVIRGVEKVDKTIDLWNGLILDVPREHHGRTVMLSNAEAHTKHFEYKVVLNRPRLYKFEDYPFFERRDIILHVKGRSHGQLPEQVVRHVVEKYGASVTIMAMDKEWNYSFPAPYCRFFEPTKDIWRTVEFISRARMFIGVDSGPSWIAQCFPDIIVKKVRLFPSVQALRDWVPLEWCRLGSYWDDRSAQIFNPSPDDAGFTWSYTKI